MFIPEHSSCFPSGQMHLNLVSVGSSTHSMPSGQGLSSQSLLRIGHSAPITHKKGYHHSRLEVKYIFEIFGVFIFVLPSQRHLEVRM